VKPEGRSPIVILLGPPGVGKGTQGVVLAQAAGARHVATGDLLRAARRDGTELGRKAQGFMDRGELVPDQLIVDLVREVLRALGPTQGVVFDGFPRTVAQAEALDGALAEEGRKVDTVLALEADDEVLVKRLSGRRSCPQCQAVYNVHFTPPRKEGVCDKCGAALVHRKDDEPATVRRRLDVYREETAPLIEFYDHGRAPVRRIDADRSVDDVQCSIRKATIDAPIDAPIDGKSDA
jgi:adenylate kinase